MSTNCVNTHLKTQRPPQQSRDFAMFAMRLLHVERWAEWRFLCVCAYLCVSVCVPRSLRGWPPAGECAAFPLLLILQALQTSLPPTDSRGKRVSAMRNPRKLQKRFLSVPVQGRRGSPRAQRSLLQALFLFTHIVLEGAQKTVQCPSLLRQRRETRRGCCRLQVGMKA